MMSRVETKTNFWVCLCIIVVIKTQQFNRYFATRQRPQTKNFYNILIYKLYKLKKFCIFIYWSGLWSYKKVYKYIKQIPRRH